MIELYFGLNDKETLTYAELGRRFGISTARTRQVVAHAIHKLKYKSRAAELIEHYHNLTQET